MKEILKFFIFLFVLFSTFKFCLLSETHVSLTEENLKDDITKTITIKVTYNSDRYYELGLEKNLYFYTDLNDKETNYFNASDIEEKTIYNTYIVNKYTPSEAYNTSCRLWKPANDKLKLLCQIKDKYDIPLLYSMLKGGTIIYESYQVNISPPSQSSFRMVFRKIPLPFIYSDEQTIQIEEEKKYYKLEFKLGEYNNENLYLLSNNNYLFLEGCSKNKNNLICQIEKEDIEEVLLYSKQIFDVYYYEYTYGFIKREIIYNITIIDDIWQKKDIYVGITSRLQEYLNYYNFIAYETNVTSISNLVSGRFKIDRGSKIFTCYFKKAGDAPLLFLCNWIYDNYKNILGNLTNEIIITNSSIKYNFRIQPVYNDENFKTLRYGYSALYAHSNPKILNFSLNETFTINYILDCDTVPYTPKELRLLEDLDNLDCKYNGERVEYCLVNRNYFENKKSGYYYTYHIINYYNYIAYSIYYEFSPFQVVIPNDNKIYIRIKKQDNNLKIGQKGTLFLVTNFNDSETNIFNESDFEEITFIAKFTEINSTYYDANCSLWKPLNKNFYLICNFNDILIYEKQQLILKETKFIYKNYTIIIFSNKYILVEQLNYSFPSLYSDSQIIDINEQKTEYNLIFRIGKYNYEDLFLYGESNNYAKLDSCEVYKKKLNCKISKQKLEELLTLNNESFKVMTINDDIGTIQLDFIDFIYLNYNLINKEDIYIEIIKVLNNKTEEGIPIAFETNITSIQNLNSYIFNDTDGNCYFKKSKINPLLLLCKYKNGYHSDNKSLENEMILDNIHYKYNFRIQPYNITTQISVSDIGTGIFLADSDELTFESQNITTVRFLIGNSDNINNIQLIYEDSDYSGNLNNLDCVKLQGVIKCEVSMIYFIRQKYIKNGFVNIYHSFNSNNLKLDYGISPLKVVLPNTIVGISIDNKEKLATKIICQNARISLLTDYNSEDIFNSSDIEEMSSFKTTIKLDPNNNPILYDITCRLWHPKDSNIIIICEGDNDLIYDEELMVQAFFPETIFYYKEYRVIITPNIILSFQIKNKKCPFLYAEKQFIDVSENDELYELNFKIDIFNNESLFLSNMDKNYINLNCSEREKKLICKLEKEKLFEQNNKQIFKVYYHDEIYGFPQLDLILGVSINSNVPKENIYLNILSLLQSYIDYNNSIAYETNVTNISNIISDYFLLNTNEIFKCFFKKSELNNLLILCNLNITGNNSLGKMTEQKILDDIHIKYNFIILPFENNEIFTIEGSGSRVLFLYSQVFDFYKLDSYIFDIMMHSPENTNNIMINSFSLDCNISSSSLSTPCFKRCIIRKEYFNNYYGIHHFYIQHTNNINSSSIFYEISPIGVKLRQSHEIILRINIEDNNKLIKVGEKGVLFFVTNYNDSENKFDIKDIENETIFDSKIVDKNENEYNVSCRLWKSINYNNNINIICNLKENLKFSYQNIKLNDVKLEYKNYTIYIYSFTYIEVIQVNYSLSFLYSDKQYIYIDYNNYNEFSNLTFMIESFNNDILYLYGANDNYIVLDDCIKSTYKILTCKILTEKLEEVITDNNESLSVGAINDNFGTYKFISILPIQINFNFPQKTNIYISLETPFSINSETGVPFGLISNITNISNLITKKFDDFCYFKKVTGMNLLYLCILDTEQTYTIKYNYSHSDLNDIHWKYNFIIKPYYDIYNFYIRGNGSDIKLFYPAILDFSNDNNLIIRLIMSKPSLAKNISIDSSSSNLECHDLDEMKICNISFVYFRGKYNGNYYFYHSNENESIIYYGCSPIYVNLSKIIQLSIDDNNNNFTQYMGTDNILYFVTNYIDSLNIFDNLEYSKISFPVKIKNNKNTKIIDGICNLWKSNDKYIRLICTLNEKFDYEEQIISLSEYTFNHNNYTIYFYTSSKNLIVKQLNKQISFLYSDQQEISINDETDSYKLKFKKKFYYNEQLIL